LLNKKGPQFPAGLGLVSSSRVYTMVLYYQPATTSVSCT